MRVRITIDSLDTTVDIEQWSTSTTLADLIYTTARSHPPAATQLYVDSTPAPTTALLKDLPLLEGSIISRTPLPLPQTFTGWTVSVSGGLSTGDLLPVISNRPMIFGRSPQADLILTTESASWEHFTAETTPEGLIITDTGSTNGTSVNGQALTQASTTITQATTVQAGGTTLHFQPQLTEHLAPRPGTLNNITPSGTAPYNRPPRQALPALPSPVEIPTKEKITNSVHFNLALIIAPLIMAGALVIMLNSMRYAVFALLSPIVLIGNWLEQKYRHNKKVKEEDERFAQALLDLKQDITETNHQEIERRKELVPDLTHLIRRATLPTTELWKRRSDAADFMLVRLADGNIPWDIPLDTKNQNKTKDEEVEQLLSNNVLPNAPVIGNLNNAGVIGIVGDREGALALARSIVLQIALSCGPADTTIGLFMDQGKEKDWSWASWLPHTRQAGSTKGQRWIATGKDKSSEMLRAINNTIDSFITPSLLLLIDSEVLTEGRDAPARELLGHGRNQTTQNSSLGSLSSSRTPVVPVAGIVIAAAEEQLPASCTTIVRVRTDADADIFTPHDRKLITEAVLAGISITQAENTAMSIAHFDDPELIIPGASLPSLVQMPELLQLNPPTAQGIQQLWKTKSGIIAPVGIGNDGRYTLDLVKDGPHGLVGGTTGSGKSEFLRTLVAGLAAHSSPEELNFILIDFKGGAAFKACERLPHTIGTISNLDAQLADRAISALEAEMDRRQRLFAQAGDGVDNIKDYMATQPAEPMPRILLVIDEFAMLAKDFPDVLQSLVSVAAVGRTLGVHMILATQRPAGVVNNDILANTNLRVALRVQSKEDSSNVIGVPDAATISRNQMGRAYIKLGQEDISAVQTALVTGHTESSGATAISIRSCDQFGFPLESLNTAPKQTSADNDLDVLIDAILEANHDMRLAEPRQVWPEALGTRVALNGYSQNIITDLGKVQPSAGSFNGRQLDFALADQPTLQRQIPQGWDLNLGNLLLIGIPGSGTTTALSSLALTVASEISPENIDIAILDMGAGGLLPLKHLPHTIAYAGSGGRAEEKRVRFIRFISKELEKRRANPQDHRPLLILVDGLATLRDEYDDFDGQQLLNQLYRVYAEGSSLGIHCAVTTSRARNIPSQINEVTTQRWVFKLSDKYDYSSLGIKGKDLPAPVPGRCVSALTLEQMHIATPDMQLQEAVQLASNKWAHTGYRKPDAIGLLPSRITPQALSAQCDLSQEPWRIPVGIGEQTLEPVFLETYEGEHIFIAGPARSGKSSLLLALSEQIRDSMVAPSAAPPEVWAICSRRSPLAHVDYDQKAIGDEEIPALIAQLRLTDSPVVLFIDDADIFADNDRALQGLLDTNRPGLLIIAAGRTDDIKAQYNHWTKPLRKAKCGLLLQPNLDYDGDVLGAKLPRKVPIDLTVGRGFAVCAGSLDLVQAISPQEP